MRLLLDTHVLLWSALAPERLSKRASSALVDVDCERWVSPITTWEIMLAADRGRIELESEPGRWLREFYARAGLQEAPLTHEVAILSRRIELPHEDPADRFIAATAVAYDLTLVTADTHLLRLKDLRTLRAG